MSEHDEKASPPLAAVAASSCAEISLPPVPASQGTRGSTSAGAGTPADVSEVTHTFGDLQLGGALAPPTYPFVSKSRIRPTHQHRLAAGLESPTPMDSTLRAAEVALDTQDQVLGFDTQRRQADRDSHSHTASSRSHGRSNRSQDRSGSSSDDLPARTPRRARTLTRRGRTASHRRRSRQRNERLNEYRRQGSRSPPIYGGETMMRPIISHAGLSERRLRAKGILGSPFKQVPYQEERQSHTTWRRGVLHPDQCLLFGVLRPLPTDQATPWVAPPEAPPVMQAAARAQEARLASAAHQPAIVQPDRAQVPEQQADVAGRDALGPAEPNVRELVPTNSAFRAVVSYRSYRLRRTRENLRTDLKNVKENTEFLRMAMHDTSFS
eukprot:IDg4453t1